MTIEDKLEDLQKKKQKSRKGGGEKKIKKQHKRGKMTARERIDFLLDDDSFVEINPFVEPRYTEHGMEDKEAIGDGVVTGYGTIDGRLVYLFAQDFTVMGGSLGAAHAEKICKVMDMAEEMGAPFIGLNDSGGARIQEGVEALDGFGKIFKRNSLMSGVVPQISVILGPCAGGAVYSPALTDFIFMVEDTSKMFLTGPDVIKSVTGEEVSAKELGGVGAHGQLSGVAHFTFQDEQECLLQIRELLSYLPSNNMEDPPEIEDYEVELKQNVELRNLVPDDPNEAYDMKQVVDNVIDDGTFFEVQAEHAKNIVVGFARLNGKAVGIIANQPKYKAGCLDIDASDKAARFIRMCDNFNLPLLTFVDVPGFLPGVSQEYNGIIRHGAKILYAYTEASVPKITLVTRKAYGGGYIAMCSRSLDADLVYAWPTAEIAVMGPRGAANIIYRKEINNAENSEELLEQKVEEYRDKFANPYIAAQRGIVNDVIEFKETTIKLAKGLEMLQSKRVDRPERKHGNMPL